MQLMENGCTSRFKLYLIVVGSAKIQHICLRLFQTLGDEQTAKNGITFFATQLSLCLTQQRKGNGNDSHEQAFENERRPPPPLHPRVEKIRWVLMRSIGCWLVSGSKRLRPRGGVTPLFATSSEGGGWFSQIKKGGKMDKCGPSHCAENS